LPDEIGPDEIGPDETDPGGIGPAQVEHEWSRRIREVLAAEVSPVRRSAWRLAAAVRELIERTTGTQAPVEVIDAATSDVDDTITRFDGYGRRELYEGFAETANSGDPHAFFDRSPVIGRSNPLAPPLLIDVVDGKTVGRVTYGAAYEGPPGCVHGGFIAAAFDDMLGLAQSRSGTAGMTGTLTVRYRKPTPLHAELTVEAELVRVEGRKKFTEARMYGPDGELTAEAEAVFITIDFEKFKEAQEALERQPHHLP
jgi:acyl-coenzyme A thioesterase PaaI-like protein